MSTTDGIDYSAVNHEIQYMNKYHPTKRAKARYLLHHISSHSTDPYQSLAAMVIAQHLDEVWFAQKRSKTNYHGPGRNSNMWSKIAQQLRDDMLSEYFDLWWGLLGISNPPYFVHILVDCDL